jgi:hypothetical protein
MFRVGQKVVCVDDSYFEDQITKVKFIRSTASRLHTAMFGSGFAKCILKMVDIDAGASAPSSSARPISRFSSRC